MLSIRFLCMNAALSVLLVAGHATAGPKLRAVDETAVRAAAATPMKSSELERLYAGRTWKWKTGGGYFSGKSERRWFLPADSKRFAGWAHEGKARYYAEGNWYTMEGGKVCLNAIWGDKRIRSRAINCFLHREKDGVIYQKPSIGGKWYVFRNNPVQKDDEVQKLVSGDLVAGEVTRIKDIR
ncbi:DUF995 domain-containing protein [Shinella sp. HZN7]|uniref:DUF995 domain-containing protein n=1 Tax=Shinella sp. (strain HZN7) TaxID=879274 RepID=UPI0007DA539F|nr:DUF995 domain-containing protein [Shinella sp. HZN7]ANH09208.1 hypothetical protein shn_34415 [Shinella sp. HZN7]